MAIPWKRKLFLTLGLMLKGNGYDKAKMLEKHKLFAGFGDNIYWYSRNLPSDPEMIYLHNNIKIATGVYFCTHDIIDLMYNDDDTCIKKLKCENNGSAFKRKKGKIEVFDNVFIGANSTIMYNVSIGPNAIIAANSVVTKSVPPNVVVGGNPAKIIGSYDDLLTKRIEENE